MHEDAVQIRKQRVIFVFYEPFSEKRNQEFAELSETPILEPQRLTSPTVKVRRMGYLLAIPSLIQDREFPIRILKRKVLDWAKENYRFFRYYSLELPVRRRQRRKLTGELKTLDASRRYINTCEELGIIVRMKGFRISKIGKVLSTLATGGNPFELSIGQLFVLSKLLLEKDYDCLSTLLRILSLNVKDELGFFQQEIQRKLLLKTEKAIEFNKLDLVDVLKKRMNHIKNWKSARRYYLENIKASRIEWMLDLRFLAFWNQRINRFEFQRNVDRFFTEDVITYKWLNDEFPYVFTDFYSSVFKKKITNWTSFPQKDRLEMLETLLAKSMKIFMTGSELGKISANEFFEYALAHLIQTKSIVASLSQFEEDLLDFMTSGKLEYRYTRTVSRADKGYIMKLHV